MRQMAMASLPPCRASLPSFAALRAFDAAARTGGIRRAAGILGIDASVVSRHLRELESWTGTALVERNASGVTLTRQGHAYHARIAGAIDAIAAATALLAPAERRLAIWVEPGFAAQWLLGVLDEFSAGMPEMEFDVRPSDEAPPLQAGEVAVDIRYYAPEALAAAQVPAVVAHLLASPVTFPVASPRYLECARPIASANDLPSHILLHERDHGPWRRWLARQGIDASPAMLRGPRLWNASMTLHAARLGHGVALANPFLVGPELHSGRLHPLSDLRGASPACMGTYVLRFAAQHRNSPLVGAFHRWLGSRMQAMAGVQP